MTGDKTPSTDRYDTESHGSNTRKIASRTQYGSTLAVCRWVYYRGQIYERDGHRCDRECVSRYPSTIRRAMRGEGNWCRDKKYRCTRWYHYRICGSGREARGYRSGDVTPTLCSTRSIRTESREIWYLYDGWTGICAWADRETTILYREYGELRIFQSHERTHRYDAWCASFSAVRDRDHGWYPKIYEKISSHVSSSWAYCRRYHLSRGSRGIQARIAYSIILGMFTFSPESLPPVFGTSIPLEEIGEYTLCLGLTQKQWEEIIFNTHDPHDIVLRRFTGDMRRFSDTEALERWYNAQGRFTFSLVNHEGIIAWIWWWRPSDAPNIIRPISDDIPEVLCSDERSIHTSGIRIYPMARSQWLALPFVSECTQYYRRVYPHACIFVDVDTENIPSQKLYKSLGYICIGYGENHKSVAWTDAASRMIFVDIAPDASGEVLS